jgi:hypothetical protein
MWRGMRRRLHADSHDSEQIPVLQFKSCPPLSEFTREAVTTWTGCSFLSHFGSIEHDNWLKERKERGLHPYLLLPSGIRVFLSGRFAFFHTTFYSHELRNEVVAG